MSNQRDICGHWPLSGIRSSRRCLIDLNSSSLFEGRFPFLNELHISLEKNFFVERVLGNDRDNETEDLLPFQTPLC